MRALLGCVLGLLICSGLVADDKKDAKIDAKLLVGKWRLKDDKDAMMVLDFGKDGKLTMILNLDGKEEKNTGAYKVEGNTLTLMDKEGGKGDTEKLIVTKLTDTEMVARRAKAKKGDTYVRIKDK